MNPGKFALDNSVVFNLLMIMLIGVGIFAFYELPKEENPEINFNWVIITTPYPDVVSEEIEKLITIPLEEAVDKIDDIDFVSSSSTEGLSTIFIRFKTIPDETFDKRMTELRREIEAVDDIPEDAEDTEIIEADTNNFIPLVTVSITADTEEKVIKEVAEELQDRIEFIEGVDEVQITGIREREIWVEVDADRLYGHRLNLSHVAAAIGAKNLSLPAGTLKQGRTEFLIRTIGEVEKPFELKKVIIRTGPEGELIRVADIATVIDTFEEALTTSRFNRNNSVSLSVFKDSRGNTIKILDELKRKIPDWESELLPAGAQIHISQDLSHRIRKSLTILGNNALTGMALVVFILFLTLGLRPSILVALSIPFVVLTTMFTIFALNQTLNTSTLLGIVIALGIIVDDSIIITENIYRHYQLGKPMRQAIEQGVAEIVKPVFTSTLTTISVFMPLMLMPGIVGKFMRVIPLTVIVALLASTFEAFFILPLHIYEWGQSQKLAHRGINRHSDSLSKRKSFANIPGLMRKFYIQVLTKALNHRWIMVILTSGAIVFSFLVFPYIKVIMFADDPFSLFYIRVTMPPGSTLAETDRMLKEYEKIALSLPKEELESVTSNAGIMFTDTEVKRGTTVGQVIVDVVDSHKRQRSLEDIIEDMRQRAAHISAPYRVKFAKTETGPPVGMPVEVKIQGKNLDKLLIISQEVKQFLTTIDGVKDIQDDYLPGKQELQVRVREEKARLMGLTDRVIATEIKGSHEGLLASVYREEDEEIDILVKFRALDRDNLKRLKNMKIASSEGLVPLKDVVDMEVSHGFGEIRRFDFDRTVTVSADVDSDIISPIKVNQIVEEKFKDLYSRYPGYKLLFRGEFDEFKKSFKSLGQLMALGVGLIYIILSAQFKSFVQPFIILFTVPFAFIGVMLGLIVSGNPFSMFSLYGLIALAGIAVNDAIVMITFINELRKKEMPMLSAVIEACNVRMRPIILTTITTILGLLPLSIGLGGKSLMWSPLATTIVWGLLVSSMLTLFMIPVIYTLTEDFKGMIGRLHGS